MSHDSRHTQPGEPALWQPSESGAASGSSDSSPPAEEKRPKEYGGRKDGLDPTRYGDWEKNGRCIDF